MSRLIDAELLKEHISSYAGMFTDEGFYVNLQAILNGIDFQPTVQPQGIDKDRLIGELDKLIKPVEHLDITTKLAYNKGVMDAQVVIDQQPQIGWIPCSERLPEEDGKYLCSYGDGHVGTFCFATNLYLLAPFNFGRYKYNEHKGFYECDSTYGYYEIENVIAWQPLPQPYKESEEE